MNSLNDAIHQLVRFDQTFEPRTADRAYHDKRFSHYNTVRTPAGLQCAIYTVALRTTSFRPPNTRHRNLTRLQQTPPGCFRPPTHHEDFPAKHKVSQVFFGSLVGS
jgi:hypothetical protein